MNGMMIATKNVGIDWYLVGTMWQVSGVILFALGMYTLAVHFWSKSRFRDDKDDSTSDR